MREGICGGGLPARIVSSAATTQESPAVWLPVSARANRLKYGTCTSRLSPAAIKHTVDSTCCRNKRAKHDEQAVWLKRDSYAAQLKFCAQNRNRDGGTSTRRDPRRCCEIAVSTRRQVACAVFRRCRRAPLR